MSLFRKKKGTEMTRGAENTARFAPEAPEPISLPRGSHTVTEEFGGYEYSFEVNDAFRPAKSHAGEVDMLSTYAPGSEYGKEGDLPCIAVMEDDVTWNAIDGFLENGTFDGAAGLTALSGRFLFKAKCAYFGDIMYFYAFTDTDGFWEKAGLCMIYPESYAGTRSEEELIRALDEAASSFSVRRLGTGAEL